MIRLTLIVVAAMGLIVLNGGTGFLAKLFVPNIVSAKSEIPRFQPMQPGLAPGGPYDSNLFNRGATTNQGNPRGWRNPSGFNGFNNRRDDD